MFVHATTERLMIAVFFAVLLHGFGFSTVGFDFLTVPVNKNSMQVILVQKSTIEKPEKADFLAQSNSEGSGSSEAVERPSTPLIAPFPDPHAREIATPPPPEIARALETPDSRVIASKTDSSQFKVSQQQAISEIKEPQTLNGEHDRTTEVTEEIPASLLMQRAMANFASMQAELDEKFNDFSNHTRSKRISVNTQEFKYAAYMDSWRRKVESIGNLNYPEAARASGLTGRLIMEVALSPEGLVKDVQIKRSSGHSILDQAALRIVQLASPYSPFPEAIRNEVDILYITATWHFIQDSLTTSVQ